MRVPSFLLLLLPTIAVANDGSGHMASSGTVTLIKGKNPNIRLIDERLNIELPSGKVRVVYHFINEGPATKTLMAFPEEGYMHQPELHKKLLREGTLFGYFRSYIDGERAKVKRVKGAGPDPDGIGYKNWWVKEVPFARGETHTIVNEYQGGLGWGPPWTNMKSFSYTLQTGGTWKGGKIGNLQITIDATRMKGLAPIEIDIFGKRQKKTPGIWTFTKANDAPTEDLAVTWYDGFMDFNVDGRSYPEALYSQPNVPPFNVGPELRGNEVYAPVTLIAAMLKGSLVANKSIKVGTQVVKPEATFVREGRTMAPIRRTLAQLDGKTWWSNGTLYIRTH